MIGEKMDKIIYERGDSNEDGLFDVVEPKRISFDVPSGLKIEDFKLVCKRLASAIGYSDESIEEAFGNETLTELELMSQARFYDKIKHEVVDEFFDLPPSGSEK